MKIIKENHKVNDEIPSQSVSIFIFLDQTRFHLTTKFQKLYQFTADPCENSL